MFLIECFFTRLIITINKKRLLSNSRNIFLYFAALIKYFINIINTMSKKNNDPDSRDYLNFFNLDIPLEEDNDDDDYNFVEDILTNPYEYDEDYYLSIPKKEVNDIMNDAIKTEQLFNKKEDYQLNYSKLFKNNNSSIQHSNENNIQSISKNSGKEDPPKSKETRKKFRKPKKVNIPNNNIPPMNKTNEENKEIDKNNNEKIQVKPSNEEKTIINNMMNNIEQIPEENKAINQMDIGEMLVLLLKQYDFVIQLLIQNLMLSENRSLKYRCYNILFQFYMYRQAIIDNFKLPQFPVQFNFNQIFTETKDMLLRFQLSFFQPPILELLPILSKFTPKKCFTKEETIKILKEFFPFINPLYLPITNKFRHGNSINTFAYNGTSTPLLYSSAKKPESITNGDNNEGNITFDKDNTTFLKKKIRRKFDAISDNLLLLGLKTHGKKNIDAIQQLWLPSRSIEEIKHRIKNLTCQSAPDNIIKRQKKFNETMLSKEEFHLFLKGIEWFGCKNKWNVISRYFLPDRSSTYLEEFFLVCIENKVLSSSFDPNYIPTSTLSTVNCNRNSSYFDGKRSKKRNIEINEELFKEYSNTYKEQIENLSKEITNINTKNKFYTPEETFEKFDIPSKIKKDQVENHIITRNKTNQYKESILGNISSVTNHKNKNLGFDFQIENGEDGTYEKLII